MLALLATLAATSNALAQDANFYAGKTFKIIVGLPPGGGADAYARLVQRHLGRHLPGAPAIVTQNMPGAGSLRSVMGLNASPEDGTVMAHFSSALLTESMIAPERVSFCGERRVPDANDAISAAARQAIPGGCQ